MRGESTTSFCSIHTREKGHHKAMEPLFLYLLDWDVEREENNSYLAGGGKEG